MNIDCVEKGIRTLLFTYITSRSLFTIMYVNNCCFLNFYSNKLLIIWKNALNNNYQMKHNITFIKQYNRKYF